jgi:hypothetical protein
VSTRSGLDRVRALTLEHLDLEHLDLPNARLDIGGTTRTMDPFTADAIGQYLAYRHNRWPRTGNPAPAGDPTQPFSWAPSFYPAGKTTSRSRRARGFTNSDGDLGKQFRPEC